MDWSTFFVLFFLNCFCIGQSYSSLVVYNFNAKVDEKKIGIKDIYFKDISVNNITEHNRYYEKVNAVQNYTLDEKCEKGLDFGVGFQLYTPYVDIGQTKSYDAWVISGIIPHVTKEMMRHCCPKSNFTYGYFFNSIQEIEDHFNEEIEIDISFPVYGLDGKKSVQYKDFPFIPVVTAPKIVLLVPDQLFQDLNIRTKVLMTTIFNAWPMLIFITVSAMLAGLIVWLLDRKKNSQEFPPTFFSGAWEGIWWAFVTMTTVGYGDRSPKSIYARAFCILWILMGIILISLFTGLVTAALSASATPVFNVQGSKIGAVRGSIEYQVGVGLNAEMIAFDNHLLLLDQLTTTQNLHAVMIDNFILSKSVGFLSKFRLRLEREIDYPLTYGIVMKKNSSKTAECFHKFTRHHPQKIFEIISLYLKPVKNPTDAISLEVSAAEKLFYEEPVFQRIMYTETGLLVVALIIGVLWEFFVRNKNSAAYRIVDKWRNKPAFPPDYALEEKCSTSLNNNGNVAAASTELESLILEYNEFHSSWIEKVQSIADRSKVASSEKAFV